MEFLTAFIGQPREEDLMQEQGYGDLVLPNEAKRRLTSSPVNLELLLSYKTTLAVVFFFFGLGCRHTGLSALFSQMGNR